MVTELEKAELQNALEKAIDEGDAKAVAELIRKGADPNKVCDVVHGTYLQAGDTPLNFAIDKWYNDVARVLIDNGADVNAKSHGETPLVCAAKKHNFGIVKPLLEKGADAHVVCRVGWGTFHGVLEKDLTALGVAKNGPRRPVKMLALTTEIFEAADRGDLEAVTKLTERTKSEFNLSELVVAIYDSIRSGEVTSRLENLIKNGADVNEKVGIGVTPLSSAIWDEARGRGEWIVVKLLIEKGADVNAISLIKKSPAEFMEEKTGTSNVVYEYKPLQLAVLVGEFEIAELLIAKGADVNAKNNEGKTALDYARQMFGPGLFKHKFVEFLEEAEQSQRVRKAEENGPRATDMRRQGTAQAPAVKERRIPGKRTG